MTKTTQDIFRYQIPFTYIKLFSDIEPVSCMLSSKWKSVIGSWETLFSNTFPLKNSRYFRQLSLLLSEMIPLLLTTSIYFSSSQRKQYICWNVTNKQASRWFERAVATIASNELLNFDILECAFMSVRCFANVTLDIFSMIPWVLFLFFS